MSLEEFSDNFFISRLSVDFPITGFKCGDDDLEGFIINDAKPYMKTLLAVTYVIVKKDDNTIVGYFSVLNDKISADTADVSIWRKLKKALPHRKHYRTYPAVKLGRFAICSDLQGKHIGRFIIDSIKSFFIDNNKTGCRFITVDAYRESLGFYEKQGFIYMDSSDIDKDTRQMYFDLAKLSVA